MVTVCACLCVKFPSCPVSVLQESPEVRRVTVVLLGQLVRLGSEKARLNKEVHSSLVSVLLNLTDPSPEVIQVKTQSCRWLG